MRTVTEAEALPGLKFRIVEGGGKTVQRAVQQSNPTASNGCQGRDCLACKGGAGSGVSCRKSNVVYRLDCNLCPEDQCTYVGETSRNLYARAREHVNKYMSRKTRAESFITTHQDDKHSGLPADFTAKVVESFKDFLSRQVLEGVDQIC